MPRLFWIPVLVAAATFAAVVPATASAKPPSLAVTALAGNSTGAAGSFCGFDVVVTYSPRAKHADMVVWTINNEATGNSVGGIVPVTLGPSPFTPTGLVVQLPAGSYYFDVQLLANGRVLSDQKTGVFTTTGICPTAGPLATYP